MDFQGEKSLLDDLLIRCEELRDQGRPVTIEDLCAEHPELIKELRRRDEALRAMSPLLDLPTASFETKLLSGPPKQAPSVPSRSASCCATFRDLEFHAAGGLGEVFMALGEDLNRKVALKFLKKWRASDAESRRRFLMEAEITGRLEHPGIVPVYSLGQDNEGHPCYAMRFIRGETLEEEIHRFHESGGGPSERSPGLRLLVKRLVSVCNAIAYAHSRGVLHRDIKPKNVMLDKYDETLVVDWGLARPFNRNEDARRSGEETLAPSSGTEGSGTPTIGPVGTPAYMSPEQAENDWEKLGPASDVYCLGTTLYAVLTGRAPFSGQSIGEVLEDVRRGNYTPPRQVNRAVPRPLDAICRKAMSLNPSDRYASALDLADDLDRWIADEPVSAYREPWHVRLARWGRRHRTAVGTLSALILTAALALALIAAISDHQKREIRRQYERAEANFHLAHEAVDTMLSQVGVVDLADIPQMEQVRKDLLEKALRFSQSLAQNKDNPLPPLETARAYRRVGDIQGMLGDDLAAESAYQRAVDVLKPRADASPDARRELARAFTGLGVLWKKSNRFAEAKALLNDAVALRRRLVDESPGDVEAQKELADARYQRGALLARMPGKSTLQGAGDDYRDAMDALTELADSARDAPDARASWARYANNLALLQVIAGRREQAEANFREAKDVQEKLAVAAPSIAGHRWRLARTCTNLAVLIWTSRPDVAEELDREALALQKTLADQFPAVPDYSEELAIIECNLAFHLEVRAPGEAKKLEHDALRRQIKLVERFGNVPRYRQELAVTYLNLGSLLKQTDPDEADRLYYSRAYALQDELVRLHPDISMYRDALGRTLYCQSLVRTGRREFKEARWCLEQSVAHHLKALVANPRNDLYREHARDSLFALAKLRFDLLDLPGAADTAERLPEVLPDDPEAYYRAALLLTQCMVQSPPSAQDGYLLRATAVLREGAGKKLIKDAEERIKKIEALLRNKPPQPA